MVLTLKAKEGFEEDNDFEVGQSGLIGNHATKVAFDGCDVLVMLGTDFPYREFLPSGKTVVQLDVRGEHIGRRTSVDHPWWGTPGSACSSCCRCSRRRPTADTSTRRVSPTRRGGSGSST